MDNMRVATCGDCVHAVICKQVNGGWFSPENPAYCKGFKDRTKFVEVVRSKDCKRYVENKEAFVTYCKRGLRDVYAKPDDFCSYGERKDNEI
jgi:hypothetical protein